MCYGCKLPNGCLNDATGDGSIEKPLVRASRRLRYVPSMRYRSILLRLRHRGTQPLVFPVTAGSPLIEFRQFFRFHARVWSKSPVSQSSKMSISAVAACARCSRLRRGRCAANRSMQKTLCSQQQLWKAKRWTPSSMTCVTPSSACATIPESTWLFIHDGVYPPFERVQLCCPAVAPLNSIQCCEIIRISKE